MPNKIQNTDEFLEPWKPIFVNQVIPKEFKQAISERIAAEVAGSAVKTASRIRVEAARTISARKDVVSLCSEIVAKNMAALTPQVSEGERL